jgi:hypothetical protein
MLPPISDSMSSTMHDGFLSLESIPSELSSCLASHWTTTTVGQCLSDLNVSRQCVILQFPTTYQLSPLFPLNLPWGSLPLPCLLLLPCIVACYTTGSDHCTSSSLECTPGTYAVPGCPLCYFTNHLLISCLKSHVKRPSKPWSKSTLYYDVARIKPHMFSLRCPVV